MKKLTCLLLFSFFSLSIFGQTRNYDQELADLLQGSQLFEARDYYDIYEDSIQTSFVKCYYDITMLSFFGRESEWEHTVNEFLNRKPKDITILLLYYNNITNNYVNIGNYQKAIEYTDYCLNAIRNDSLYVNNPKEDARRILGVLEDRKIYFSEMNKVSPPSREYINNSKEKTNIPIEYNGCIIFKALVNGKQAKILLDTGCQPFFFMGKEAAHRLEVNVLEGINTINLINEAEVKSGYIDSININQISFRNFPVTIADKIGSKVLENSDSTALIFNDFYNSFDIIMGLPAIKYFGNLDIDMRESIMTIYENNIKQDITSKSNMGILNGNLRLDAKLNGIALMPMLDTGLDFELNLDKNFYLQHKDKLPIDSLLKKKELNRFTFNHIVKDVSYDIINNGQLELATTTTTIKKIYIFDKQNTTLSESGSMLGLHFFAGKKVFFDFQNMIFSYKLKDEL